MSERPDVNIIGNTKQTTISGGIGFIIGIVVAVLFLMLVGADFSDEVEAQSPTPDPIVQKVQEEQAASEERKQAIIASKTGEEPATVEEVDAGTLAGADLVAILESAMDAGGGTSGITVVLLINAGGDVRMGPDSVIEGATNDIQGATTAIEDGE